MSDLSCPRCDGTGVVSAEEWKASDVLAETVTISRRDLADVIGIVNPTAYRQKFGLIRRLTDHLSNPNDDEVAVDATMGEEHE